MITAQFSIFFLFLFYNYDPVALKHIWFFTYPIILLYFENMKSVFYWMIFMIFMILISSFQPYIETSYDFYQSFYLSFVLVIVSVIMHFYKMKMEEAKELILRQQNELQVFNAELESKVKQKTQEFEKLNESLEIKVKDKVNELIAKDKLISVQSKQAVMGEMISMIAHQWRQPLSTITLQISNLHFKRLLGEDVSVEESDKVLNEISDNIVYLSETIDDFQTYFRPNKEKVSVKINELLEKAINFALPRTKDLKIKILNNKDQKITIKTYVNEMIQVVLNLINNAIDAFIDMEKEDAKIEIYAEEENNLVKIYVKDNASGISKENLTQIFEPYFSTKGKNGTGLGLYMSQMIVQKQFQGELKVKTSSMGTTFIIEIPK
jgi:C4-dicarboxylate-specific signal transduction histidine kinase